MPILLVVVRLSDGAAQEAVNVNAMLGAVLLTTGAVGTVQLNAGT